MKHFIFILLIVTLFESCSHSPASGDWYEHKGTRERIRIEKIGREFELYQYFLAEEKKFFLTKSPKWMGYEPTQDSDQEPYVLWVTTKNNSDYYYSEQLNSFKDNWSYVP